MAIKQVIVWRNDLKCRVGKKMAQAGHASNYDLFNSMRDNIDENGLVSFQLTPAQLEWYFDDCHKKIVLQVDSEADLLLIFQRSKELDLPVYLVTDSGLTEWKVPTKTCICIGPAEEKKIDEVTGERGPLGRLKLM